MKIKNSIMQTEEKCFICGALYGLDPHHVMNNPFKKKSEKYGGMVYLCRNCHDYIHIHPKDKTALKRLFQTLFEQKYSHKKWMEEFGRNYL